MSGAFVTAAICLGIVCAWMYSRWLISVIDHQAAVIDKAKDAAWKHQQQRASELMGADADFWRRYRRLEILAADAGASSQAIAMIRHAPLTELEISCAKPS